MSILQLNIWTCEVCGEIYITKQETSPFSDPVVEYPTKEDWEYLGKEEKLACPGCVKEWRDNETKAWQIHLKLY